MAPEHGQYVALSALLPVAPLVLRVVRDAVAVLVVAVGLHALPRQRPRLPLRPMVDVQAQHSRRVVAVAVRVAACAEDRPLRELVLILQVVVIRGGGGGGGGVRLATGVLRGDARGCGRTASTPRGTVWCERMR